METDNENPDELETVATQIKKYFAAAKRDKTGRNYNPGEKFKRTELWTKAAENCIAAGADPYSFVRASFLYNSLPGGPFPNGLSGDHAIRCYQNYRRIHGVDEDTKQDVYESEIKQLLSDSMRMWMMEKKRRGKKLSEFFLDEGTREDILPAFVRVVLMPKDEAIFQRWGKSAYVEVTGNPRLLKILEKLNCDLTFVKRFRR